MIHFLNGYTSTIPLNFPRICYDKYTATASGTAGIDYDPDAVLTSNTYERWNPSGAGTMTLDFGSSVLVDYVALAALSLISTTLTLSHSTDDVTYTSLYSAVETDNNAKIFIFPATSMQYLRIEVSGGTPEIGVVYAGRVLEMMRGIYSGHTPAVLNRKTVRNLNRSIKGQFLGTSIVRTGLSASYEFSNIPITWYEQNIEPLSLFARTQPFFVAWNPLEHDNHTIYGYCDKDIAPTLSGTINYCSFGFEVDGYA